MQVAKIGNKYTINNQQKTNAPVSKEQSFGVFTPETRANWLAEVVTGIALNLKNSGEGTEKTVLKSLLNTISKIAQHKLPVYIDQQEKVARIFNKEANRSHLISIDGDNNQTIISKIFNALTEHDSLEILTKPETKAALLEEIRINQENRGKLQEILLTDVEENGSKANLDVSHDINNLRLRIENQSGTQMKTIEDAPRKLQEFFNCAQFQ